MRTEVIHPNATRPAVQPILAGVRVDARTPLPAGTSVTRDRSGRDRASQHLGARPERLVAGCQLGGEADIHRLGHGGPVRGLQRQQAGRPSTHVAGGIEAKEQVWEAGWGS